MDRQQSGLLGGVTHAVHSPKCWVTEQRLNQVSVSNGVSCAVLAENATKSPEAARGVGSWTYRIAGLPFLPRLLPDEVVVASGVAYSCSLLLSACVGMCSYPRQMLKQEAIETLDTMCEN